ncbi:hypothetical protein TNCV_4355691 [Trichonephila clavipes]|nr:hypothetical protein TNCV_4355691 [Trichonephila clavipes]
MVFKISGIRDVRLIITRGGHDEPKFKNRRAMVSKKSFICIWRLTWKRGVVGSSRGLSTPSLEAPPPFDLLWFYISLGLWLRDPGHEPIAGVPPSRRHDVEVWREEYHLRCRLRHLIAVESSVTSRRHVAPEGFHKETASNTSGTFERSQTTFREALTSVNAKICPQTLLHQITPAPVEELAENITTNQREILNTVLRIPHKNLSGKCSLIFLGAVNILEFQHCSSQISTVT